MIDPSDSTKQQAREVNQKRGASLSEARKATRKKVTSESKPAKKFRLGLTAKVIILMLIVSLGPLAIFAGIVLNQTNESIRSDTEKLMAMTASEAASNVEEWFDKNVRVLKALAKTPDIFSMVRERQEPLLRIFAQEYPWFHVVQVAGPNGFNVARSDTTRFMDYSDRDWFRGPIGGKDLAWQTLLGRTSGKPSLALSVPIKRGDNIVGVLEATATIEDLSKLVATWKQGETGFAFLVDEKNKVVSHPVQQYVVSEANLSEHPLIAGSRAGDQKGLIYFKYNDIPHVGYAKGTKHGWVLGVQQDARETFQTLKKTTNFTYILLGLTGVIVCLIALFLGRAIGGPIKKLTNVAEKISVGDMKVQVNVKSNDEIGDLGEAFSRMQESLRLALEKIRSQQ
jgi:HAMP domain-containing protein